MIRSFTGMLMVVGVLGASTATALPECPNPEGYRLSQSEVNQIVRLHESWLADRSTGERAVLCRLVAPELILANADLSEADLRMVDLPRADFRGATLQDAWLHRARLQGASFDGADLSGANLRKSDVENARFVGAQMENTILRKSNARSAVFDDADLSGAELSKVQFSGATARGADFTRAKLRKAQLARSNLQSATLDAANLRSADLSNSNLAMSSLAAADVTDADFSRANLYQVDVAETVGFSDVQQDAAIREQPRQEEEIEVQATLDHVTEEAQPEVVSTAEVALSTGRHRVQLAAFRDLKSAKAHLETLKTKTIFESTPYLVSVDLGGDQGIWHRLQYGAFQTKTGAAAWCERYRVNEAAGCFAVSP